jgi:hypothetical protein
MYTAFLVIHSLLRWVLILAGLIVIVRAISGTVGRKPWLPADNLAVRVFGISMDLQVLIGLLLYVWLSPFIRDAWGDMAATMRNAPLRFFAVEHLVGMLVAMVFVQIGRAKVRKAPDPVRKHKLAAIFFGIGMVIILLSIPWRGTPGGRPLLRGLTTESP